MFWDWILKYSSFLVTGMVSLAVGWILHRLTTRHSDLIHYSSQPQVVMLPPPAQGQQPIPVTTFTLFLWNQGKAPARNVYVGHYWIPDHNVFPDIPRRIEKTPSGGTAIAFDLIPARTLVSITYAFFIHQTVDRIISYVGSEDGHAKHIPVMLQRVWPKWFNNLVGFLLLCGLWVAVNIIWSFVHFLWVRYYVHQ
jgi:hypothetical protein